MRYRTRLFTITIALLVVSAHRLPAPIQEDSETPTPTPAAATYSPSPLPEATTKQAAYDYRGFVFQHLQKCINRDISGIVADYSDTVDYYENGSVGHSFIAQDRRKFANSWPTLSIQLTSPIKYDASNAPRVTVTFNYNFEARNGKKASDGSAENVWTLLQTSDGLKIMAEKQKVTNRSRK